MCAMVVMEEFPLPGLNLVAGETFLQETSRRSTEIGIRCWKPEIPMSHSETPEKSGKPKAYPRQGAFSELLEWHLSYGTKPGGQPNRPGTRWGNDEFAGVVGSSRGLNERTVRNWRQGQNLPYDLASIERALFGKNDSYADWRLDLRAAYDKAKAIRDQRPKIEGMSGRESNRIGGQFTISVVWLGNFASSPKSALFSGREDALKDLTQIGARGGLAVLSIIGIGGQGKSTLVREWIEGAVKAGNVRPFEAVFAFSFDNRHTPHDNSVEGKERYIVDIQREFAQQLSTFLDLSASDAIASSDPTIGLVEKLRNRKILIFLDGLELLQKSGEDFDSGLLERGAVCKLLDGLCARNEGESLAVITSRLNVSDLDHFIGTGVVLNYKLRGLSDVDGAKLLRLLHVRADDERLRTFSLELAGHPLLLHVFADAVRRHSGSLDDVTAADAVSEAMGLTDNVAFQTKLERVITSYHGQLHRHDQTIITAVSVFGGAATLEHIQVYTADRTALTAPADEADVARRTEILVSAGIIQSQLRDDRFGLRYSCHPILREGFRPSAADARSAATISLYSQPVPITPRSLAEAGPYLRAIEILTESGCFEDAIEILAFHLDGGELLWRYAGGRRPLMNCLRQFLGPTRRDAFEASVGRDVLAVLLIKMLVSAMELAEWDVANDYADWGLKLVTEGDNATRIVGLKAKIVVEIGSADEARVIYKEAIRRGSEDSKGEYLIDLADHVRQLGDYPLVFELLGKWKDLQQPTREWMWHLDEALLIIGRLFQRSDPNSAGRYFAAYAWLRQKISSDPDGERSFARYLELDLIPRSERTPQNWKALLDAVEGLEKEAKIAGRRAQGGWPIARAAALNGLGFHAEAADISRRAARQMHYNSWRRIWAMSEAARAEIGGGSLDSGLVEAWSLFNEARTRQRVLIARELAELIVQYSSADSERSADALGYLEHLRVQLRPSTMSAPLISPLPGEEGWEQYATEKLLSEALPNSEDQPLKQEELDAALLAAVELGVPGAGIKLLQMGASANLKVLQTAIRDGRDEIVAAILRQRIDQSGPLSENDNMLLIGAVNEQKSDLLRQLLDHYGVQPVQTLNKLLAQAAERSSGDVVDILCEAGADPEALADQLHPLVRAARYGNLSALEAMADRTSDISAARDEDGETALMAAMAQGRLPTVAWLIKQQVDVGIRDKKGRTALDYGRSKAQVAVRLYFLIHTGLADPSSSAVSHLAVETAARGDLQGLKRLAAEGVDLTSKDSLGRSLLFAAAEAGRDEVCEWLLRSGLADSSVSNRGGSSPLHAAINGAHPSICRLLLHDPRTDVNARSVTGRAPLHLAAQGGKIEICQLILAAEKCDPNIRTNDGRTPLHIAAFFGQRAVSELFAADPRVELGAKTNRGLTVLDLANLGGDDETIRFFDSFNL